METSRWALFNIFVLLTALHLFADKNSSSSPDWYKYPSYNEYVGFMQNWEADHPQLARLYDLGPSEKGTHRIYALKISDNVNLHEAEPKYIQIATLHHDEVLGYILALHMIDTLLSSYGIDERITQLVNTTELWFCPLMNPDYTYYSKDDTIDIAPHWSLPNFDLNRNWPCACMQGNHKYYGLYSSWRPEVAAVLKLHETVRFNLHIDMHSGTEAVIWPYGGIIDSVCDEDWYVWAAKRYVAQAHEDCGNNGYMTSCGGDGIGQCYKELYECHGTRMDFCTRYAQIKGFQIETSIRKLLPESDLESRWIWNKEALFQYYELLYTGIQGLVTDAHSNKPVYDVVITAVDHDYDSADVHTDSSGFYLRFIEKGTYSLTFSHPDYYPKTIDSIVIDDYSKKYELNVELERHTEIENTPELPQQLISINPNGGRVQIVFCKKLHGEVKVSIYDITGKRIKMLSASNLECLTWNGLDNNGNTVSNGCYVICVETEQNVIAKRFLFSR